MTNVSLEPSETRADRLRLRGPFALALVLTLALNGTAALAAEPEEDQGVLYGSAGSSEVSLLFGFSSGNVAAGGGFRHFVFEGVAPGVEASVTRADGFTQGFAFPSLRVVPLRLSSVALVITARAGRVFLSSHVDGWAYGGDAGVIIFFSRNAGFELGYEVLKLAPDSFCRDLSSCLVQRPVVGLRLVF
jgi:hypothetical protein